MISLNYKYSGIYQHDYLNIVIPYLIYGYNNEGVGQD